MDKKLLCKNLESNLGPLCYLVLYHWATWTNMSMISNFIHFDFWYKLDDCHKFCQNYPNCTLETVGHIKCCFMWLAALCLYANLMGTFEPYLCFLTWPKAFDFTNNLIFIFTSMTPYLGVWTLIMARLSSMKEIL